MQAAHPDTSANVLVSQAAAAHHKRSIRTDVYPSVNVKRVEANAPLETQTGTLSDSLLATGDPAWAMASGSAPALADCRPWVTSKS